jgi:hypothetical protein
VGSKVAIYTMGAAGLLALMFVGWMMILTIKNSDRNAIPAGDRQTAPQPAAASDNPPPLNK